MRLQHPVSYPAPVRRRRWRRRTTSTTKLLLLYTTGHLLLLGPAAPARCRHVAMHWTLLLTTWAS